MSWVSLPPRTLACDCRKSEQSPKQHFQAQLAPQQVRESRLSLGNCSPTNPLRSKAPSNKNAGVGLGGRKGQWVFI